MEKRGFGDRNPPPNLVPPDPTFADLARAIRQDAEFQSDPDMLTNISHLARSLLNRDNRTSAPIEQVKLYVPGIGTDEQLGLGVIQGALGTVSVVSR